MQTLFGLLVVLGSASAIAADIAVIVNPHNETGSMTRRQVVDLYMGRDRNFPDGDASLPIDQAATSPVRKQFYRQLVNKSVAEVNAYWARLLFTGRASPPRSLANSIEVLRTVRDNRGAIGYIDAELVDDSVKVVFRLE